MDLATKGTKLYGMATAAVLLMTFLLDHYLLNNLESSKEEQVKIESLSNASARPKVKLQTVAQFAITNIELPSPPGRFEINSTEAASTSTISTIKKIEAITNTTIPKEILLESPKNLDTQKIRQQTALSSTQTENFLPKQEQIDARISQLTHLPGNKRTFYFPRASQIQNSSQGNRVDKRNVIAVLNYMHQCVGIDIGALDQGRLMLLSNKNKEHSQIMRLASGYKTQFEQAMLKSYAPNKALVRLYPKWFDRQLSIHIHNILGSEALTQISGEYMLVNKRLYLANITINDKLVSNKWLLKQGC